MASLFEDRLKSTMTISKAISLMKDKHAGTMIERHVRALNRIAQNYKNGFQKMLKDLNALSELFILSNEKLQKFPDYEEPLCKVIAVCRIPFLKERVSDESTYAPHVIETLSLLGKMTVNTSDLIRCEIASAMGAFYEGKCIQEIELLEGLQPTRKLYNMIAVERSGVTMYLTKSLQLSSNTETQFIILNTLAVLSANSSTNCNHILSKNGGFIMSDLLSSKNDRIVFLSVEVLWNIIEQGAHIQVIEQLSGFETIRALQKLFKQLMLTSNSQHNKQLRNDLVTVVSLVATKCTNAPFVETGFLKDICEFTAFSEDSVIQNDSLRHFKLSHDSEDFELTKALMCLLITLHSLSAAIRVISEQKLIRSLFSYVIPNDKATTKWTSAQFEELQLLSLSCLSLLCPLCIEDYMTCQGSTRLLLLIEWCNREAPYFSHGNSFHGDGGRGSKISQLRYSLRLLLSMCSTNNESVLQDLHEQGIIPLLISFLKDLLKRPDSDKNSILIEIQSDSFMILSCLCENNNHRKELFGGYEGVPILMNYLKRDPTNLSSGLGHHRLFLAVIDCAWSSVVGNNVVEDIFLENGGIFVLMDLLQMSPKNMQTLLLGILVDLCDNPKSISHVTSWQGKDNIGCWTLLAQLWRNEEKDLEVPRDMCGTLAGTTLPLVGAKQSVKGMPPLPTYQSSAAIQDISDNVRAKIYALSSKIGFQYPNEGVTTEDKITICIIENYLTFKTGEVWYEVAGELAQEGLRPTTPDQEGLQEILQCCEERAEDVTRQQHELIDQQHRIDLDEEYQFYERLRDAQISTERAQDRHERLALRTSNIKYLKDAKQDQTAAIDASRPSAVSLGERFHIVDSSALNVTTFCSRHVTVATTPMKLLSDNKLTIVS